MALERGGVKIKIGKKTHTLLYTLKSLKLLTDRFEQPLSQIFARFDSMDIDVIVGLLHAGLVHENPELTEEDVLEYDLKIAPLSKKILEAISNVLGTAEEK